MKKLVLQILKRIDAVLSVIIAVAGLPAVLFLAMFHNRKRDNSAMIIKPPLVYNDIKQHISIWCRQSNLRLIEFGEKGERILQISSEDTSNILATFTYNDIEFDNSYISLNIKEASLTFVTQADSDYYTLTQEFLEKILNAIKQQKTKVETWVLFGEQIKTRLSLKLDGCWYGGASDLSRPLQTFLSVKSDD